MNTNKDISKENTDEEVKNAKKKENLRKKRCGKNGCKTKLGLTSYSCRCGGWDDDDYNDGEDDADVNDDDTDNDTDDEDSMPQDLLPPPHPCWAAWLWLWLQTGVISFTLFVLFLIWFHFFPFSCSCLFISRMPRIISRTLTPGWWQKRSGRSREEKPIWCVVTVRLFFRLPITIQITIVNR